MPPAARVSKVTKGADEDDARRRREQHSIQLRKEKRAEGMDKRRKAASEGASAAPAEAAAFGAAAAASAAESAPEPAAACVERLEEYCSGACFWLRPRSAALCARALAPGSPSREKKLTPAPTPLRPSLPPHLQPWPLATAPASWRA
jgi:hypothetical protein